jgi:hypothetical protein
VPLTAILDAPLLAASQAEETSAPLLFGDVGLLIRLLVLALGGALLAGNVMALIKPPVKSADTPPLDRRRALIMAVLGAFITISAIGALVAR